MGFDGVMIPPSQAEHRSRENHRRRKADMKRSVTMMMCEMCMGMMSMCMFRCAQKGHQLSDICLTA